MTGRRWVLVLLVAVGTGYGLWALDLFSGPQLLCWFLGIACLGAAWEPMALFDARGDRGDLVVASFWIVLAVAFCYASVIA